VETGQVVLSNYVGRYLTAQEDDNVTRFSGVSLRW
jgi:hypothetical protein